MKKLVLVFAMFFATLGMAQSQNVSRADVATQKGNYTVGLNTSGLGFSTVKDGLSTFDAGLNVGGFVEDRLALVAKVGYGSLHYGETNLNDWSYGAGLKYYMAGVLPLQLDWSGSTGSTVQPDASFVGARIGYAWFVGKNISIEPQLGHQWSTNRDNYPNMWKGSVGINAFF